MKKILLLVFIILLSFAVASCTQEIIHNDDDSHLQLAYIDNYTQLKFLIEETNDYKNRFYPEVTTDGLESDGSTNSNYSTTNVQVQGIDEGDIIKVDGERIYTLSYDRFNVIDVTTNEMTLQLSKTLETSRSGESYTYYQELYVTDSYVIVVGQRFSYYLQSFDGDTKEGAFIDIAPWYYYGLPETIVEIYDIESLVITDTFTITGYLSSSRLINDHLYVLTRQDILIFEDIDPRPQITHNTDTYIQPYENIQYIPDASSLENYTNILFLDLEDEMNFQLKTYLGQGYWGHTYVTFDSIFFAGNSYNFNEETNTYESIGMLIRYEILEDGSITFGGFQTYEGYVINQFAIDQYDETIRLVTTEGWGEDVINRLYIFKLDFNEREEPVLTLLSLLDEGIGKPGETVRSVRFNEDIVTVVTFELTDPLYIIDLSDPSNPTITSELEITGFATYQHPWKNDTLINIGYETDSNGRIIGLKIALFDTSDLFNLTQIGRDVTFLNGEHRQSYSEALYNHKALLFSETHDFFGFAMTRFQYIQTETFSTNVYLSEYMLFDVDTENAEAPISVKATFSHQHFISEHFDLNNDDYQIIYAFHIQRAVYIGNTFYVISNGGITSYDLDNLSIMKDELLLLTVYS
ncbi:MAG: beta-propeller domain-containing protein [Firmicutes bacterium]|nr:beta-propeller domain-containing protein [Bacillota bacterium]